MSVKCTQTQTRTVANVKPREDNPKGWNSLASLCGLWCPACALLELNSDPGCLCRISRVAAVFDPQLYKLVLCRWHLASATHHQRRNRPVSSANTTTFARIILRCFHEKQSGGNSSDFNVTGSCQVPYSRRKRPNVRARMRAWLGQTSKKCSSVSQTLQCVHLPLLLPTQHVPVHRSVGSREISPWHRDQARL